MKMERITPPGVDFGLVYFTANSLLADDRHIVLIQNREECRNLFLMDMATGSMKPLTSSAGRTEYPHKNSRFTRNDFDAILDASISVHSESGRVFYLQGRKICRTDCNANETVLATIPDGTASSCTHISADGRKFLLATVDARAFQDYDGTNSPVIDQAVQSLGLSSQLRVIDAETGAQLACETVERAWITHVQFHPVDDRIVLYNHEWPSDCGIRRIWLWNGCEHVRVRTEGEGRSRDDWTCHEVWERGGGGLVYHGKYNNGLCYLGRATIRDLANLRGIRLEEIPFPPEYRSYGHFSPGNNGMLVTDGYYIPAGEAPGRSRWISLVTPSWGKKRAEWRPLCEHGSDWSGQEAHPHPIFNHAGDAIYFNSNVEGHRAVYRIGIG